MLKTRYRCYRCGSEGPQFSVCEGGYGQDPYYPFHRWTVRDPVVVEEDEEDPEEES